MKNTCALFPKEENQIGNVRVKNLDILSMDSFNRVFDTINYYSPLLTSSHIKDKNIQKLFTFTSNFNNNRKPSVDLTKRNFIHNKTNMIHKNSNKIIIIDKKMDFLVQNIKF